MKFRQCNDSNIIFFQVYSSLKHCKCERRWLLNRSQIKGTFVKILEYLKFTEFLNFPVKIWLNAIDKHRTKFKLYNYLFNKKITNMPQSWKCCNQNLGFFMAQNAEYISLLDFLTSLLIIFVHNGVDAHFWLLVVYWSFLSSSTGYLILMSWRRHSLKMDLVSSKFIVKWNNYRLLEK